MGSFCTSVDLHSERLTHARLCVQIPLLDDDTLWVCPGSHLRPNSEGEEADLAATATLTPRHDGGKPSKTNTGPIGEAVPVSLKAGDGVVYLNCILHVSALFSPKAVWSFSVL